MLAGSHSSGCCEMGGVGGVGGMGGVGSGRWEEACVGRERCVKISSQRYMRECAGWRCVWVEVCMRECARWRCVWVEVCWVGVCMGGSVLGGGVYGWKCA